MVMAATPVWLLRMPYEQKISILDEVAGAFGLAGKEPPVGLIKLLTNESGQSADDVRAVFKSYSEQHGSDYPPMPRME